MIIVHGTDCVDFSEINYGNLRIPLMKWFIEKSIEMLEYEPTTNVDEGVRKFVEWYKSQSYE